MYILVVRSGHPDEDELYESSLISTNMVFEIIDDELAPLEKYWATVPKIQMLDPNKVSSLLVNCWYNIRK